MVIYFCTIFFIGRGPPYKHIVILKKKKYLWIYWEFESGGGLGPPKHLCGSVFVSMNNLSMYCQLILHWMLQYGISSKLSRVMDKTISIDCPLVCAIIALCVIVFPELQINCLHLHIRIRDCTCMVVLQLVPHRLIITSKIKIYSAGGLSAHC